MNYLRCYTLQSDAMVSLLLDYLSSLYASNWIQWAYDQISFYRESDDESGGGKWDLTISLIPSFIYSFIYYFIYRIIIDIRSGLYVC